jgi:hypothetical protein
MVCLVFGHVIDSWRVVKLAEIEAKGRDED